MRRLEKIAEEYSKQNAELMEMIREYRVSIDHAADMLGVYAQERDAVTENMTAVADALVWLLRDHTSGLNSDVHRLVGSSCHVKCVDVLVQAGRATWIDRGVSFTVR